MVYEIRTSIVQAVAQQILSRAPHCTVTTPGDFKSSTATVDLLWKIHNERNN